MDERSQERLATILSKDKISLVDEEVRFLRARRSYLTKAQVEEYHDILDPKVERQTSDKETVKPHAKSK